MYKGAIQALENARPIKNQKVKYARLTSLGGPVIGAIAFGGQVCAEEITQVPDGQEIPIFDNLMKRLEANLGGELNVVAETAIFRSIRQGVEESFDAFELRLRKQGTICGFSNEAEELKMAIIEGSVDSTQIRSYAVATNYTLEQIVGIARNLESIRAQSAINTQSSAATVATVNDQFNRGNFSSGWRGGRGGRGFVSNQRFTGYPQRPQRTTMVKQSREGELGRQMVNLCYRCNKRHPGTCWAATVSCYNCGKIGHLGRACRAPNSTYAVDQDVKDENIAQVKESDNPFIIE